MSDRLDLERYQNRIERASALRVRGKILKSVGMVFEASLPKSKLGSLCRIEVDSPQDGAGKSILAEVIGFREKRAVLMALEEATGVHSDSHVWVEQELSQVRVGNAMLGRVLDARGTPIDGKGPLEFCADSRFRDLYQKPVNPLQRPLIKEPMDLGVRAMNAFLTCGRGQRLGIFAGSGVGKSTLLGMIARYTSEDINVIALIGERAREVREFIERDLGSEGLARSVVIVSTAEDSPLLRLRGAFLAAAVAEHFRDQSKNVLLLMDSLSRFCMAQREIGLSLGEPPASRGYTPSVFSILPKLLERAGTGTVGGAITGLYTVLVEGDDLNEPVADSARSILDGHVVLSRKLAQRNHYPAIDILSSSSRVMPSVVSSDHRKWALQVREWIALYAEVEDMIHLGAYKRGSNLKTDRAIDLHDQINEFLKQDVQDRSNYSASLQFLQEIQNMGFQPDKPEKSKLPLKHSAKSQWEIWKSIDETL